MRKRLNFKLGSKVNKNWFTYDEMYAMMLGYMVNQFWKKYNIKPGKERY